jgi:hypothetical protein
MCSSPLYRTRPWQLEDWPLPASRDQQAGDETMAANPLGMTSLMLDIVDVLPLALLFPLPDPHKIASRRRHSLARARNG